MRLPSIEALHLIQQAQTAIKVSERTVLLPDLEDGTLAHEQERRKAAWERVDKGWKIYELLPQTMEEQTASPA